MIDRDAVLAEIGEFQIRFNETGDSHERVAYASAEHCMLVIKAAPAVNRWIPCSERMPNEAGEYLVCGKWNGEKSKTWICRFIIFGDIGGFVNPAKNPPISFWMPIPDAYEPPESEVQEDDER